MWSLRHELAGGWILHSALTVRHSYSDDFKVLVDRLFAAWRRRSSGDKRFRRTVEGSGLVSVVPVFQVTWSVRAGFHPHFHVVWFGSGDEGRADVLSADVDRMWRKSVEAVGLPKAGRAAVHSELITNSQGFVEYLDPDHERHPNNDCVHPDHPGCGSCRESDTDSGVDEWGTGDGDGGGWDGGGSSDPWASMQVLSDVGMSGVRGNRRHQAVMAEYLSGLRGRRRVVSGFDRLGSAYGPVDLRVVDASPGGARCWVHPRLVAQVELCRHGGVGSLLHDGLAVASADPVGAAGLWGDALGRRVVVGVHREDGAPVLSLADGRPSL